MSSFAKYTHNYSTRLKDTPFYRKGARGPDPLKTFVAKSYVDYTQNAGRIRDMRFAKSNELNKDYALRSKREDMISATYANERDPVKLAGLHGRIRMKLSRTGGALSDGMPQVVKLKADHHARKYGYTAKAGTAKKAAASVGMFTSTSNEPVAPTPTQTDGGHTAPESMDKVQFRTVKGGGSGAGSKRKSADQKMAEMNAMQKEAFSMIKRNKSKMSPADRLRKQARENNMSPYKQARKNLRRVRFDEI